MAFIFEEAYRQELAELVRKVFANIYAQSASPTLSASFASSTSLSPTSTSAKKRKRKVKARAKAPTKASTKVKDIRVTLVQADKHIKIKQGCTKRAIKMPWEMASLSPKSGVFSCVSPAGLACEINALSNANWFWFVVSKGACFKARGVD